MNNSFSNLGYLNTVLVYDLNLDVKWCSKLYQMISFWVINCHKLSLIFKFNQIYSSNDVFLISKVIICDQLRSNDMNWYQLISVDINIQIIYQHCILITEFLINALNFQDLTYSIILFILDCFFNTSLFEIARFFGPLWSLFFFKVLLFVFISLSHFKSHDIIDSTTREQNTMAITPKYFDVSIFDWKVSLMLWILLCVSFCILDNNENVTFLTLCILMIWSVWET